VGFLWVFALGETMHRLLTKTLNIIPYFLLIAIISAQPDTLWTKIFGEDGFDFGTSIQNTNDGGFIIIGHTDSFGNGSTDIWLIKTDSNGYEEWSQTYGGNNPEFGNRVQQTSDGGFIMVGYTQSYGNGGADVWLIKTDPNGNEEWNSMFGGNQHDIGYSVQQTMDSGYIIIGDTYSFGNGGPDIWLIKTDSYGNEEWNQTYGGDSNDNGRDIHQVSDGGYIAIGSTRSNEEHDPNVWLIKTDSNGNNEWNWTFGGSNDDYGYSLIQTLDGGIVITGSTASFSNGDPDDDIWLIKTDANGYEEWSQTYGGETPDLGHSVQQTSDGGFIIVGHTMSYGETENDVFIVKTDSYGDEEWNLVYGGDGNDSGKSVQQTNDEGFVMVGATNSFGDSSYDMWLISFGWYGCTDPFAYNYDPEVISDDGSCIYAGCLDEGAINFDPEATVDDGSCYYLSDIDIHFQSVAQDFPMSPMGIYVYSATIETSNLRIGDEIGIYDNDVCIGFIQLISEIYSPLQFIISIDNPDSPEIDGFTSGNPLQFRYWDASEEIEIINIDIDLFDGTGVYTPMGTASVDLFVNLIYGCMNPIAINYNNGANVDDGSCVMPVYGCMIDDACNYNPEANIEDESCLFYDCMMECDGEAFIDDCGVCSGGTSNHLENSDQDCFGDCDGVAYYNECYYCVEGNTGLLENHGIDCNNDCDGQAFIDECGCVGGTTGNEPQYCFGCIDQYAVNYDENAIYEDDSCLYPNIGDLTMDGEINVVDLVQLVEVVLVGVNYIDYMDLNQDGFLNIIDIVALVDIILNPETLGCTDPNAPNYNPEAFYDDGSCLDIVSIIIGNQEWMVDNLKVTHFRNGDPIPQIADGNEWGALSTGAYCFYNNTPLNTDIYGNLYNWYAINDERNLAPVGWHIPTDDEWLQLINFLGGDAVAGGALKSIGTLEDSDGLWHEPNFGATNESGFTALPSGYRSFNDYTNIGYRTFYWTSTEIYDYAASSWRVDSGVAEIANSYTNKQYGYSVRCLKDFDSSIMEHRTVPISK
jgi:uncharacterized protein (TIGR02145 family)